jgi:type IV pilus assembly protein PilV
MMMTQRFRPRPTGRLRARARGFTLIEILVSLLIFSVGILGMAGFQAMSTRNSVDASERSRAALMANEVIAKMWEARSTSLDEEALGEWKERLKKALNQDADGVVTPLNDDIDAVLITITWPSVARDSATSTYITEFAIPPYTE